VQGDQLPVADPGQQRLDVEDQREVEMDGGHLITIDKDGHIGVHRAGDLVLS